MIGYKIHPLTIKFLIKYIKIKKINKYVVFSLKNLKNLNLNNKKILSKKIKISVGLVIKAKTDIKLVLKNHILSKFFFQVFVILNILKKI